jgi:hypothetical protein
MVAANEAGIVFYRSGNNVILTEGLGESGLIPPEFLIDYTPLCAVASLQTNK